MLALAGELEQCIGHRGRQRRHPRLAHTARCTGAGHHPGLDHRRIGQAVHEAGRGGRGAGLLQIDHRAGPHRRGRVTRQLAEQMRLALAKDKGEVIKEAIGKTDLGKEARNEIDKKEEKATDGLLRVRNIRASFDPDYLNYGTQAKMRIAEIQAKAGKLDPATQEKLYKFATFRRDAANNINSAIKDNSGATVTDQELRRNMVELPNAGSGMFDGDDPVTFRAKLDRAEQVLALGIARTRYLRQNGFTGPVDAAAREVPIEKMRELINGRARQIEGEISRANPQMTKPMVDRQVDLMVKKEFGI